VLDASLRRPVRNVNASHVSKVVAERPLIEHPLVRFWADGYATGLEACLFSGEGLPHLLGRFQHRGPAEALFGAAVINQRLEALLLWHGYKRQVDTVPEVLGGGIMEILTKDVPVI
jgi:hypothetical protein